MSSAKSSGKTAAKSAVKDAPPSALNKTLGWLVGPGRSFAVFLAIVTVVTAAVVTKWPAIVRLAHQDSDLWLTPERIEITPPPPWIKADIRAEVASDASLNGSVSLLEPQLVERVSDAFALHPWVARVERVTLSHPARVVVDLVYRRPVAMVEVPGGLYPIDGAGILLPSADFTPQDAGGYPRVIEINSMAIGPVGTAWGDPRVEGAGYIAALLIDDWNLLGLHTIVPSKQPEVGSPEGQFAYELLSRRGTRVLWGPSPVSSDDVAAIAKVARLRKLATLHGTLDSPEGPQDIDLRHGGEAIVAPRTADLRATP